MKKMLLVADDLTGALDSGIQFAKAGISTYVILEPISPSSSIPECAVLCVNAESRHLAARDAYDRVYSISKWAAEHGFLRFYKKVDSTLRGNIGAEITAMMDAVRAKKLIFAPAFPKNGRITREGIQYCNGTPIHRTMFAQDPFNPVKHSRVADVLKEQTTVYCSAIEEMDNLPGILQTDRQEIIICDGIDDRQLEQIGEALTKRETFVSAGSAGLAGAIAKCICKAADQSKVEQNAEAPIFLIGSVSQIALDQIDWAEQAGFRIVQLTERQKFSSDFWKSEEKEPLLSLLKDATAREMPVIVVSIRSQKELMHGNPYVQWEDLQEDDIPKRVARSFGNLAKEMADRGITHTFVVFGGDTLVEVTRALGGVGIKPLDEIGTGCVYAKVSAGQKDYFVCSKAGGFGGEDVIVQIWNWFSEMKRKSQMEN